MMDLLNRMDPCWRYRMALELQYFIKRGASPERTARTLSRDPVFGFEIPEKEIADFYRGLQWCSEYYGDKENS